MANFQKNQKRNWKKIACKTPCELVLSSLRNQGRILLFIKETG